MNLTTDALIAADMSTFRARRGQRYVHAGGRWVRIRTRGERALWLPNGVRVKISVDDSGHATQIEEADRLHGIVRPDTIRMSLRQAAARRTIGAVTHPQPVRTTLIPRSSR